MEEKKERKTVRDELAEKFISILESDEPMSWVKGWSSSGMMLPYNGETGRNYNGVNRFVLLLKAMEQNWSDPRYYTFHQVNQMEGCHVRAGEKATGVEYWLLYDTKQKKSLTFNEYERLIKSDPTRKENEFRIYAKTAYVFNAAQVEGLQPLVQPEKAPLEEHRLADEVIKTMAENMEVKLVYGGNEAYYRPSTDTIHLPRHEDFNSTEDRIATTLHELSHATSSPSRLDRSVTGFRQDPEAYSLEELRAEICSCYVSAAIDLTISESVIDNNRAYVQHWLSAIKKDHNALFTALKDADKIADYMIDKGRVEDLRAKLELEAITPKTFDGATYEIWHLKNTPENERLQFSNFAFASTYRLTESRYEKVYEARAGSDDNTLEKIYVKYNTNHPADYQAHSLSMSDVVVVNQDGKKTAWYCDTFCFEPLQGFSQQTKESRGHAR